MGCHTSFLQLSTQEKKRRNFHLLLLIIHLRWKCIAYEHTQNSKNNEFYSHRWLSVCVCVCTRAWCVRPKSIYLPSRIYSTSEQRRKILTLDDGSHINHQITNTSTQYHADYSPCIHTLHIFYESKYENEFV